MVRIATTAVGLLSIALALTVRIEEHRIASEQVRASSAALAPIHVETRVTCSSPNEHGIRTASVVASSPPWATLRFDRVEQSPELCTSPALIRSAPTHRLVEFKPLVIGGGRVIAANGSGS